LPNYDKSILYDFTKTDKKFEFKEIDYQLDFLQLIGYDIFDSTCSAKHILLTNVVNVDTIISSEIFELEITVEDEKVSIKTIYEEVNRSSNIDLIFWYQKIVFSAIMKLICAKTKILLNQTAINYNLISKIFKAISIFYSKFLNLPSNLITLFENLASNKFDKENDRDKVLDDYIKSDVFEITDYKPFKLPKAIIKLYTNMSYSSFEDFTQQIHRFIKDFKCFIKVLRFLNYENNKYYNIHTRNPKILYDIVHKNIIHKGQHVDSTKKQSDEMVQQNDDIKSLNSEKIQNDICNSIKKFHHYCYNTIFLLSVEFYEDHDKVQTIKNIVSKYYDFIINSLYTLGKQYSNHYLKKITLNLITVMEFSNALILDTNAYKIDQTKFFHFIINELNVYGIKFCRPIKYDYIVFQNTEFILTELDNDEITHFDNIHEIYINVRAFKIITLYFNKNINYRLFIRNKIMLWWKGEYKIIEDVYSNIFYSLSIPSFVFELYDVVLKFSIAAIFCYTIPLLQDKMYNNNNNNVNQIILEMSDYPETFKEFIVEYNSKLSFYIHTDSSNNPFTPKLENVLTELIARLYVLGIVVKIQVGDDYTVKNIHCLENIQFIKNCIYNVNLVWKDLKDLYNYV